MRTTSLILFLAIAACARPVAIEMPLDHPANPSGAPGRVPTLGMNDSPGASVSTPGRTAQPKDVPHVHHHDHRSSSQ